MIGRHPGHVTMQGQILSDMFKAAGYPVIATSDVLDRYARLVDIVRTLIRERRNTDIMIIEVYGGPSFVVEDIASLLGKAFGHRIIMWLHGGAIPDFMARFPRWTRRVLRRADLIVAPSKYLARAVGQVGFDARVIPNVIDLTAYPYRHRESVRPRLFWMRNMHPIWNPEMAVRVLARLRAKLADATLVMAGPDKGSRQSVERLAQELKVDDAVRFAGFLDAEGKAREADAADIYINTNRIDNMPVAVVEALACGLPVVTTNVGGIPDLLANKETGLLVPDNDDEAMVQAIEDLVGSPELAARLSANGRQVSDSSSWDRVRLQWDGVFAELTGKSGTRVMNIDHKLDGAILSAESGKTETL